MNQPILPEAFDDATWVEVLQKTEEAYARSVQYQVALEKKNEELEQAHQFISAILATMSDVLVVTDHDFRVIQVNRAFESLSGYKADEVVGRLVWDFLAIDEAVRNQLEKPPGALADIPEIHVTLKGKFNTVPLAVRCSCQQESCAVDVGRVMIGRPIGELLEAYAALKKAHEVLKEAQDRVVQSEKMAALGRLVAGVAHELNNPVSFVYANLKTLEFYLPMLRQHCTGTSEAEQILADIPSLLEGTQEGVQRISHLIEQLKQFSRAESEHLEPVNLKAQVEEALNWVDKSRQSSQAAQVGLDMDGSMKVMAHPGKLQQILINILQNAADAMETEPLKLEISAMREDAQVCLRIRDFGPGISPKVLDKIFDPFFTTKPVGQRTGLGLSISYELAREMGGKLNAWNHPEGGAVFQLCLPEAQQ
jgi:two-component system sensor histidine kinase HupT/HoxJ